MFEQTATSEPGRYWAFISYSHLDERWASWLHRALETYRLPSGLAGQVGRYGKLPQRLFPVFRDREELASTADLPARIHDALNQSRALVVICSPNSVISRWVAEEIRTFKAVHGEDRVYCLIVAGEPHASDIAGREAEECFPEPIRYRVGHDGELTTQPIEPLAADARPAADGRNGALIKLLAGLLGVELDLLRQRDEQRRRRRNRLWGAVATALIVLLSIGIWYANWQRKEAERQRDLARARQQVALARQLAAQSARIRVEQPANIELASLLAIEAARRLDTLETQQALQAALHLLPQRPLRLADGSSAAVARYSHDGRIVLASQGDQLSAFSTVDGRRLWQVAKHHQSPFPLTPDGNCVLVADPDPRWRAIRLSDGSEIQPAPPYTVHIQAAQSASREPLSHLAFSADGRVLAAGPLLIETGSGALQRDFEAAPSAAITFDASDQMLALQSGRHIDLFDRAGGKHLQRLEPGYEAQPHFSPDNTLLVVRGYQRMDVFDTRNGQRLFELACNDPYADAVFSPDTKVLITACGNVARLHDAHTGSRIADLRHDRPVNSLCFSRDGERLLTASYDNTVRIWRLSDRSEVWRAAHLHYMNQAVFAPDERSVLAAGMGGICLWPLIEEADVLAEHPGTIWALAASPDGQWIAAAGVEPQAQVILAKVPDGPMREMLHPDQRITELAFSPNSNLIAIATASDLHVVPVAGGSAALRWKAPDYPYAEIVGTAFTPDGQVLVASNGHSLPSYFRLDRCVLLGPGEQARCTTRDLRLNPFSRVQAFFSPDGRRVAFCDTQGKRGMRVWDTIGEGEFVLPAQRVEDLVFSEDLQQMFLASTAGGVVDLVDTTGRNLRSFRHEDWADHLALAPGGQYLAAGLSDPVSNSKNRVVLWDLDSGEEVARYARPGDSGPLVFLPDGHRLVYADGQRLRIVSWRTEGVIAQACLRLSRNLDCNEWQTWLPDESYRGTCPQLPAAGCEH